MEQQFKLSWVMQSDKYDHVNDCNIATTSQQYACTYNSPTSQQQEVLARANRQYCACIHMPSTHLFGLISYGS